MEIGAIVLGREFLGEGSEGVWVELGVLVLGCVCLVGSGQGCGWNSALLCWTVYFSARAGKGCRVGLGGTPTCYSFSALLSSPHPGDPKLWMPLETQSPDTPKNGKSQPHTSVAGPKESANGIRWSWRAPRQTQISH